MLTDEELAELTGYKSAKIQIIWLRTRGWVFELNPAGRPRVDRKYYCQKMGNSTAAPTPEIDPNWAATDGL